MTWSLLAAAIAIGAASMPHCAAMCGAPCTALTSGGRHEAIGFHAGRIAGYAVGGAVAAASVGSLGAWMQHAPSLRPLWMLLQLGFLALGLWWLVTGRATRWNGRIGALPRDGGWQAVSFVRPPAAGFAWITWPCAASQGALVLASLADDAPHGALVMMAFAVASMPGLFASRWAWRGLAWIGRSRAANQPVAPIGFRIAGLALVGSSGWALAHGLWDRIAALCIGA